MDVPILLVGTKAVAPPRQAKARHVDGLIFVFDRCVLSMQSNISSPEQLVMVAPQESVAVNSSQSAIAMLVFCVRSDRLSLFARVMMTMEKKIGCTRVRMLTHESRMNGNE